MELVNFLTPIEPASDDEKAALAEAVRLLAVMLSPFAPHLAEEVAEGYGATTSLQAQDWPAFDPALVVADSIVYAVQVNGKLRGEISVAAETGEADVRAAAEADAKVSPHLEGKTIRKVIFVKGRLVNFVVAP